MARSVANWIGIAAICVTILFIPMWAGAQDVAQSLPPPHLFLNLPEKAPPATDTGDKDCIGDFHNRERAQRFFLRHGGPARDPHGLDSDGDGKACEDYFGP